MHKSAFNLCLQTLSDKLFFSTLRELFPSEYSFSKQIHYFVRRCGADLTTPESFETELGIPLSEIFSAEKKISLWRDEMGRTVIHWALYHQVRFYTVYWRHVNVLIFYTVGAERNVELDFVG